MKPVSFPGSKDLLKQTGVHHSIYSQREFFETAFKAAPALPVTESRQSIKGILFNHHLLAPHFIAQAFNAVKTERDVTILVISPNHFRVGIGPVLTSRYFWQTPYGELAADLAVIEKLLQSDLVKVDETPFENEHGIRNIVAFVKRDLPNAKIVPLIIKDNLKPGDADKLADKLFAALPGTLLVAASLDFSHYQTLEVANAHDAQSLAVVSQLRFEDAMELDIDSRPGLRAFLKLLWLLEADGFTLLQHSNSAIVANKLAEPETTSYITGYFLSD